MHTPQLQGTGSVLWVALKEAFAPPTFMVPTIVLLSIPPVASTRSESRYRKLLLFELAPYCARAEIRSGVDIDIIG